MRDTPPHAVRRNEHEAGEGEEQHVGVCGPVPARTEERSADTGQSEDHAGPDANATCTPVRHDADQCRQRDEDERGGGGVLGNRFTLTTGAGLNITTHRIYRVDNSLVPFKVIPDQEVALDLDTLVKGHDTQLEAAIEYLNKTK